MITSSLPNSDFTERHYTHSEFNLEFDLLADSLYRAQQQAKELELDIKQLNKRLQALCNNVPHMSSLYAFIQKSRKGSVDYARIPELKEVDLEEYRKEECHYWQLSKL